MATIQELVGRLDELPDTGTLYARRPWTPESEAKVVGDENTPSGLDYMLEVALAREAVEVWSEWRNGAMPSPYDACAAVLHYAEHDAYLPTQDVG